MWYAPDGVKAEYDYGYGKTAWFQYWQEEHQAVREDVGLVDLSPFGKILIQGPDAQSLMQRICANNVDVDEGRVVYTQWLNARAGIEADVTVARLGRDRYLVMTSAATEHIELSWLKKNRPEGAQVEIVDITSAEGVFGLSGPRSRALLQAYGDSSFADPDFPFGTSQHVHLGPVPVRAQRISYTGETGWEIFVDSSFAPCLFELLMSNDRAKAPKLVGMHAGESLRTEKGYRHFGHDIGYTDTPFESGLMFACKPGKPGGFIGRDALIRAVDAGSQRRLLQFSLDDDTAFLYHNEPIFLNGALVGSITTGTYGHTLGRAVGLGWVRFPDGFASEPKSDQKWQILVAGDLISATVCEA